MHVPSIESNEMNSLFVNFEALHLHIHFNLVQPRPHPFGLGLLPCKGVQQPCLYAHLSITPTWSTTNGTQSFRDLAHELGCLMVLHSGFPLLHHEHLENVKEGQKLLGHFVHF